MSRRTHNSRDAVLFPEVDTAVLPEVSVQSSHPAASSNPAISSVASPLTAAQLSPDCLAAIVQAVKASMAAEPSPVSLSQPSSLPASVAVVGTSCPSLPVPGGVPGQDLGSQASALLASWTVFALQSSLASSSSSQGRPAFVVPSFVSTFAPQTLRLLRLERAQLPPFPLRLVFRHLSLLIQRQFFINLLWSARVSRRFRQKPSLRSCLENL